MGLSSVVQNPDVRAVIDSNYSKPDFGLETPIQAPAETEKYGLIGGAFPYVFGMWCASDVENCEQSSVPVADAINVAESYDSGDVVKEASNRMFEHMRVTVQHGVFSNDSYKAAIDAYRMAVIAYGNDDKRVRHALNELGNYTHQDIDDLHQLYEVIPKTQFMDHDALYVNYQLDSFKEEFPGSNIDLVADGTLYDFKTTKYLQLDLDEWRKLVAYVALYHSHQQQMENALEPVRRVGVYFARHGVTWEVDVTDILESETIGKLPSFLSEHSKSASP